MPLHPPPLPLPAAGTVETQQAHAVLAREEGLNTAEGNGSRSSRDPFFLTVFRRRASKMRIKQFGQIAHIREPARKADLKNALIGCLNKMTGVLKTTLTQILLKGKSEHILEEM